MRRPRKLLTDMPPRAEEELDPVTLHNQALMNMDARPTEGLKNPVLLQPDPLSSRDWLWQPVVALPNMSILTWQQMSGRECPFDLQFLTYLYDFLDAMITCQTSAPEEETLLSLMA